MTTVSRVSTNHPYMGGDLVGRRFAEGQSAKTAKDQMEAERNAFIDRAEEIVNALVQENRELRDRVIFLEEHSHTHLELSEDEIQHD